MPFRSLIRALAALCGLLLLAAAVAHERAAERCIEGGGRWEAVRFSCATRTASDVQGIALRQAIDAEFRHRRDASMLHGPGGDRNIISTVLEERIPPGTSIEDAGKLLRAAGFKVDRPAPCGGADAPGSQCLRARIDDYAFALFGSTAVQVQVQAAEDRAVVRTVSAEIVVERLL